MIDDDTPAIYWSVVECDVAIICACMPCLPVLLRYTFPSIFGEPADNYSYYSNITANRYKSGSLPLDGIKKDTSFQVTSSSETDLINVPVAPKPFCPSNI